MLGIENEGVAGLRRVFDDNALADLDKPDAQVIDGQFLIKFTKNFAPTAAF